ADGGRGGDGRRLADADDAALRHVVHVDDNLRDVADGAELVELHVGVHLPARRAVHDAVFEQGVVDAHDDAARGLRLARQQVDHHADVLHRRHLRALDHAGLNVHAHLGDLYAADLDARDAAVLGQAREVGTPATYPLGLLHAEPGAGFLPGVGL